MVSFVDADGGPVFVDRSGESVHQYAVGGRVDAVVEIFEELRVAGWG